MWLALRFRHWALDCRITPEASDGGAGMLVTETTAQRQRIVAADPVALAAGARNGMALADARLRLPEAVLHERHIALEKTAMVRLAGWAWGYSSQLHWALAGGDKVTCTHLIMEIGASQRLFGGRAALWQRIETDLTRMGYRYRAGLGETPQAALAFARADESIRRRRCPDELSIACLDLSANVRATLSASGLRLAGELFALPSGTLIHRFGPELSAYLERLRGQRPHGLALFRLPSRYNTRHELNAAVDSTQGLVFVLRRVFDALAGFLLGADSAIQTLRLSLIHEREPPTRLQLALSAPTHDARHLEHVAHQRLERVQLVAPVVGLRLVSDRLRRSRHKQAGFWPQPGQDNGDDDSWPAVLDRLRARLGHEAVQWLHQIDDHRAEHASVYRDRPPSAVATPSQASDPLPRPLWLFESPRPISDRALTQWCWLHGPERIESGWWQQGQRRDYYRVLDTRGRLLWVFRDLEATDRTTAYYYVHGLFG
ncbi:DNA polymerase Y family protein [Salinisphaera sp. Q1T1-3]|uniref:Y-family DNA polymerase n=1 Tax=Salinisphaera sp. Q1T1-3 TaxID=2321229 RepID=UPI000E725373|nr:DNA polymerase Y family protein [Salinisphaera sp. Q1T1-3]RJS95076.1 DNA polymerase Y family protein [Salinisphaera sp. Q1T1-3]